MGIETGILAILGSYFLGSIPFGFLIARWLYGVDIRRHGSGNIGATNVYRTLGPAPGLAVFVLDIGKGWLPAQLAANAGGPSWGVACGVAAIVGHSLSPFLRFKGGKGVATGGGVVIGVAPLAALVAISLFALALTLGRWVSLASIIATVSVPIAAWAFGYSPVVVGVTGAAAALIVWRHRENIKRLMQGAEPKLTWRKTALTPGEAAKRIALSGFQGEPLDPQLALPPALLEEGGAFVQAWQGDRLIGQAGDAFPTEPNRAAQIWTAARQLSGLSSVDRLVVFVAGSPDSKPDHASITLAQYDAQGRRIWALPLDETEPAASSVGRICALLGLDSSSATILLSCPAQRFEIQITST